jgi:hypothetical protein
VTREEWDAWRALDTPRFIELWHARMRQLGFPPPRGPRGEPRRRPDGPPGRRPDPERVHELLERLRPDPQWFSELAGLDPRARRDAIESRLRERALEVLARSPDLASPEQLERLRTLTGREFLDAVHDHLREVAPPPFPPFGGPGGQRPPPPRGGPHPPPGGPPPGDGPPHHPPPGPPPHERPID